MKIYIQLTLMTVGLFGIVGTVGALDANNITITQALVQWALSFVSLLTCVLMEGGKKA